MVYLFMLVCSSLLLVSEQAHATDTAAVAAALKDEAAECRYVLQLCEEARHAAQRLDESNKEMAARRKKGVTNWTYEQNITLIAQSKTLLDNLITTHHDLAEAMKVVRAKHETMPPCFNQCSDRIDLDWAK